MLPIRIGLTGAIGTGKSSVASLLADHGAEIISGDELGRIALELSPEFLEAVRERFGNEVFTPDGKLRRRELGKRVFSSPEHVRWLTALTFPRIHELWNDAVAKTTSDVIVFDAALLLEWGIEKEFDHLFVVIASPHVIRDRLSKGGRFTAEEITSRTAMQLDPTVKTSVADKVIVNDESLADLWRQVNQFWKDMIEPELEQRRILRNVSSK